MNHYPPEHTGTDDEDDEGTAYIPLVSLSDADIDEAIQDGARVVSSTPRGDRVRGVLIGREELGAYVRVRTGPDEEIDVLKDRTFLPHS